MFERDLVLPSSVRYIFKEPIGEEIYDVKHQSFNSKGAVITVGDIVSLNFRKHGLIPDLSIYDGMTERYATTEFSDLVSYERKEIVINPAGIITQEMASCIHRSIYGDNRLIFVKGEEDLALLPCIYYAPYDTNIVYGWPGRCMMLIVTNNHIRNKTIKYLLKMEEI